LALSTIGVLINAATARAEQPPMTFRAIKLDTPDCGAKCPEVIVADGVIEESTPQAFFEFAKEASLSERLRSVIFINSPGGNVVASMELGTAFRRLHSAVIVAAFATQDGRSGPVSGRCLSACVYAMMGAARRVVPSGSCLGLHRMSVALVDEAGEPAPPAVGRATADPRLVAVVAKYAARMGVDPAVVRRAESLTPGVLDILSPSDIARFRLGSPRL
jgi:hypothetical protein